MKKVCIDDTKKLFLYKSLFYKRTTFYTNSEDEEIKGIVDALNIKQRRRRIDYIYDYCCNKINEFYKGKNVCGFKNNKCINQQYPNCKYINGCCRLCLYQSTNGCKTSNLTCKLFYCSSVTNKYTVITHKDLKILKLFSLRQRFIIGYNYFTTREAYLRDLYIGSITVSAIRNFICTILGIIKITLNKKKN